MKMFNYEDMPNHHLCGSDCLINADLSNTIIYKISKKLYEEKLKREMTWDERIDFVKRNKFFDKSYFKQREYIFCESGGELRKYFRILKLDVLTALNQKCYEMVSKFGTLLSNEDVQVELNKIRGYVINNLHEIVDMDYRCDCGWISLYTYDERDNEVCKKIFEEECLDLMEKCISMTANIYSNVKGE